MSYDPAGTLKLKNEYLIPLLKKGFRRLRFKKEIESDFADYFYTSKFLPSFAYIWVGLIIFVLFLYLDYLNLQKHFSVILPVRLVIAGVCSALLIATKTLNRRIPAYIGFCLGIVLLNCGVTFVDILGMRDGVMSFPVGTLFVCLFVSSIAAIPFRFAALTLVTLLISYAWAIYVYTAIGGGIVTLSILFAFIGLTGLISNYQREYEARREYIQGLIIANNQRSISNMLDNIPLGIFTIQEDLKVSSWSHHLHSLLGQLGLATQDLLQLAENFLHLTELQKSQIRSVLLTSFGQPEFSFQVNSDKMPSRAEAGTPDQRKFIDITWSPILVDGVIKEFLVTLKDVTGQILIQQEKDEKEKELLFLGLLLSKDPKKLHIFLQSGHHIISDSLNALQNQNDWQRSTINDCFIQIHTLKGNAGTMGFQDIEEACHHIEHHLKLADQESSRAILIREMKNLGERIQSYATIYKDRMGHTPHSSLSIPSDRVEQILDLLDQGHPSKSALPLQQYLESLVARDLETIIQDLAPSIKKLASILHKEVPSLVVHGTQGVMITQAFEEDLRNALLHLIRNSMDHGLETAQERITQHKSAAGKMEFTVDRDSTGFIHILYQDDGRGLNIERLKQKIEEQKNPLNIDLNNLQAVAESIFESGLSTAEQVTTISGRGVGMSAIRSFLARHHCTLQIQLGELRQGFVPMLFVMKLSPTCTRKARE